MNRLILENQIAIMRTLLTLAPEGKGVLSLLAERIEASEVALQKWPMGEGAIEKGQITAINVADAGGWLQPDGTLGYHPDTKITIVDPLK